jgi:hypothetical protein
VCEVYYLIDIHILRLSQCRLIIWSPPRGFSFYLILFQLILPNRSFDLDRTAAAAAFCSIKNHTKRPGIQALNRELLVLLQRLV